AHGAPVPTTAGCGARTGTTACPATMAWPLSGSTTWARPSCTIPAPCPPSVSQSPGGFSAKGRVGEQSRPPDRSLSVITPLIGGSTSRNHGALLPGTTRLLSLRALARQRLAPRRETPAVRHLHHRTVR